MSGNRPSPAPRRAAALLLTLSCLLLPGCRIVAQPDLQSVEEDREQGAKLAERMLGEVGVLDHTEAWTRLDRVATRLVGGLADPRFEFEFHVLDQDEPNAFAAPGGYVFVSRGLLVLTNDEDELAGIVGHEITHVTERHSAKRTAKNRVPNLLTLPGDAVARVVSEDLGNLLNAPVNTLGGLYMAGYGRDQEEESDELGMALASRVGYDPAALAAILTRMEKESELRTGEERKSGFFDTHPMTPDRVEDIEKTAARLPRPAEPEPGSRESYLRSLEGLPVGDNPALGVFRGNRYLQPNWGFTLEFPDGWLKVKTPRAVGAVQPDGYGFVFIGIQARGDDPGPAARAFVSGFNEEFGLSPSEERDFEIGAWPAHLATYADTSGSEEMHLHFVWVAGDGLVFKLIAAAPDRFRPDLADTAMSLRTITDAERRSVRAVRLRIATARRGEGIAELGRRTGNTWNATETALANALDPAVRFQGGELVKIARSEAYR